MVLRHQFLRDRADLEDLENNVSKIKHERGL